MKRTFFRILAFPLPTRKLRNYVRKFGGPKIVKHNQLDIILNILNGSIDLSCVPSAHGIMKYMQEANLKLLCAFDKFASMNKIDYFMIGGAIVGKIRHNGCTPWDDDIDVGMDAENYNKLLDLLPEFIPNNDYYIMITSNVCRIIHSKTKAFLDVLRYGIYQTPYCYGADGVKQISNLQQKFIYAMHNRPFLHMEITNDLSGKEIENAYRKVKKDFLEIYDIQKSIFSIQGDNRTCVPLHADCKQNEYYSYDTIFPTKKLEFQSYRFKFPHDPELYAIKCWGDIWKFPPDMFRMHEFTKDQSPEKLIALRQFLSESNAETFYKFTKKGTSNENRCRVWFV